MESSCTRERSVVPEDTNSYTDDWGEPGVSITRKLNVSVVLACS